MGGFAVPERALTQGEPPILDLQTPAAEPGGYALVPARLLSPLTPAGEPALSSSAILAWVVLTLECRPDGGGVRLQLADLACRVGRAGTVDSGRKLGAAVRQLEAAGWLKAGRDPHGKRYWPQRLVDPRKPGRPGWYATISRADLARIGQPLDRADARAGVVSEADLVTWARWQGIVRCDRVRIGLTQIAEHLGVSRRTAETVTARLVRAGWLAADSRAGAATTYWRADADRPGIERDLARSRTADEPTQNQTHHPRKTGHMHSYLSARSRSLPPSPPAEPASSAATSAATGEGFTASETTTSEDRMTAKTRCVPGPCDAAEQVCDAVASAWPTPVGRPPIHRGRLRAKLLDTAAIERLGVQLLIRHLTENQGAVRDPLAVVMARIDALPPAPASNRPEPPWCGGCSDRTVRLAVVGHQQDGVPVLAPCEACGGGTPRRTALELRVAGSHPTEKPPAAAKAPRTRASGLSATGEPPGAADRLSMAPNERSATPGDVETGDQPTTSHSAGYLKAMAAAGLQGFVRPPEQMRRVGWRNAPRLRDDG